MQLHRLNSRFHGHNCNKHDSNSKKASNPYNPYKIDPLFRTLNANIVSLMEISIFTRLTLIPFIPCSTFALINYIRNFWTTYTRSSSVRTLPKYLRKFIGPSVSRQRGDLHPLITNSLCLTNRTLGVLRIKTVSIKLTQKALYTYSGLSGIALS